TPELRELVLDRVEAVWAVRDHLAKLVLLHRLDVLLRDGLIQILLAAAPADLGVAALFLHHAEAHPGGLEDLHDRAGDRLVAPIVARRAADPVEVLDLALGLHDRDIEALGPRQPLCRRQPPRVPRALDVLERLGRRRG